MNNKADNGEKTTDKPLQLSALLGMTLDDAANYLKAIYPAMTTKQAESVASFIGFGWKIDGCGANNSVDMSKKLDNGYVREDGVFRYA